MNFFESCFPNGPTGTPDYTSINNFISGAAQVMPSDAQVTIALGYNPTNSGTGNDGWTTAQYATAVTAFVTHFRATFPRTIIGWEIGNELLGSGGAGTNVDTYCDYFNAAANAIHAIDPTYLVIGPVATGVSGLQATAGRGTTFAAQCAANVGAISYKGYGNPTSANFGMGAYPGSNTSVYSNATLARSVVGGSTPLMIGEYAMDSVATPTTDVPLTQLAGALFDAQWVTMAINANAGVKYGAIRDLAYNTDFGQLGPTDLASPLGQTPSATLAPTITPSAWFLSQAGKHMYGTRVAANLTNTSKPAALLATVGGATPSDCSVMVINYGTQVQSGTIGLSHWPLSSSGNGTANMWVMSNSTGDGTVSTLTVTAGVTQTVSIPAGAIAIIYGVSGTNPVGPAAPSGLIASAPTANSMTLSWNSVAGNSGTPPADPGWSLPSLTIAPSTSYTFQNIALQDSAYANNAGHQLIILSCTTGSMFVQLIGTCAITAGANNSNSMQFTGLFADILSSLTHLTYTSGAVGSTSIQMDFWDAGGNDIHGQIPITITAGAATAETGGYNALGGISYVAEYSTGTTYTQTAAISQTSTTVLGLSASTNYHFRVHAVDAQGNAGAESTAITAATLATGTVTGDPTGIQAVRAADFIGIFGVNIFPTSGQDGGSIPAEPAQINYLTQGTGHRILVRTYANSNDGQTAAVVNLNAATGCLAAPCIGHYASSNDPIGVEQTVNAMPVGAAAWGEGNNEPNTSDFGVLNSAQITQSQQALYAALHPANKVASASVVGSAPAWQGFYGADLAANIAASDYCAPHLYPNNGCASAANQLRDWTLGISNIWGNKPNLLTEFHPTLFNTSYAQSNSEIVAGYYTLCAWALSYFYYNTRGLIWFCMNDYASAFNPVVGLFASDETNPHLAAKQIKAMIHLLADTNGTARSFVTGKLNVTASNLPGSNWANSGGQMPGVIQTSNGDFWIPLLNEQDQYSSSTQNVTLSFGNGPVSLVESYLVANATQTSVAPTPQQTWTNVSSVTIALGTEFRLIHVRK